MDGVPEFVLLWITRRAELHNRGFMLQFPNFTNLVEKLRSSIKRLLQPYGGAYTKDNLDLFLAEAVLRHCCEIRREKFYDPIK